MRWRWFKDCGFLDHKINGNLFDQIAKDLSVLMSILLRNHDADLGKALQTSRENMARVSGLIERTWEGSVLKSA